MFVGQVSCVIGHPSVIVDDAADCTAVSPLTAVGAVCTGRKFICTVSNNNKLSRWGRRNDMLPPPADGSSTRGGFTSVRGRVRSPHMAKLQAASMSIAYGGRCAPRAAALWDRQTDGSRYRLLSPYGGGIITSCCSTGSEKPHRC